MDEADDGPALAEAVVNVWDGDGAGVTAAQPIMAQGGEYILHREVTIGGQIHDIDHRLDLDAHAGGHAGGAAIVADAVVGLGDEGYI